MQYDMSPYGLPPNFLIPRHRAVPRHHTETGLRYIYLVLIIVNLYILTVKLLHGSHALTMMPYGGSPRGGQPPTWPPPWGPASGGPSMPWGPPPSVGYWPPPPRHCTPASHPGLGQWTPPMPWGPPAGGPSMLCGPPAGGSGQI
jgi:hypothetical protein